jgi:membrane protease YdiL (CAAX protease family)
VFFYKSEKNKLTVKHDVLTSAAFYRVPFMVGSKFLGGLVLGYVPLRHGIYWAIFYHGAYNAILFIAVLYF